MARRGRCRCGVILDFNRGPEGYKTRCPNCKAVVRLRVGNPATPAPPAGGTVTCPCGTVVKVTAVRPLVCTNCRRILAGAVTG
jgi:hypothetical protein